MSLRDRVDAVVRELVDSGAEPGLQVAVYAGGELVADVSAGVADPATGRAVTADTPFYAYSVGKALTTTVVHRLAERGAFDHDTPVAELWPEFAQGGKRDVTIRHVLTHTAGVPGLPADVTPEEVCDWERITARVAALEPWWEPGTKTAYHAYTFGFILGEVVRRATGAPISVALRELVGEPLGVADELWFGMPDDQLSRVAVLADDPATAGFEMPADSPFWRLAPPAVNPSATFGNRADVLRADIPAGGKVTARAMARLYAALAGTLDVRLLSDERAADLFKVAYSGPDELLGMPSTWSLGLACGRPGTQPGTQDSWFGWHGVGGSYAGVDSATGVALAVCKNRLTMNFDAAGRLAALVDEG
ncbi:serine hydrolase domain-containing protein [Actinokineospora enzanensis]|uniref:serine hydrolase domain-containing protein n=1 Tax=Actinokineospora enzanensis TaxID=155975 RepID=UPI00037553CA|nr:serine hydrolase domain-containing protein [Actinokineospora enzanensis]